MASRGLRHARHGLAPEEMQRQLGRALDTAAVAKHWLGAREQDWRDDVGYSWASVDGVQLVGSATRLGGGPPT